MPNGNDPAIDEYRRLAGGASAGAAVAEPEEEDPAIAEFKRMATPPKPPEDTAAMARVTKPVCQLFRPRKALPPHKQSRLGELPLACAPHRCLPTCSRAVWLADFPRKTVTQTWEPRIRRPDAAQGAAVPRYRRSLPRRQCQRIETAERMAIESSLTAQSVQGAAGEAGCARQGNEGPRA